MMKRAALYLRVSTLDQKPSTRLYDLRGLAEQRGFEIVHEYSDHGFSGARVRRPALDEMLVDARRGQFDVVVVWACDRRARSARHFLEVLDELSHLNIKFVSFREQLDTGGPPGCAVIITIISAVAELERSLIIERIRAGMRRAKLEGRHIGRKPLNVDRDAVLHERAHGQSLTEIAKTLQTSRATVSLLLKQAKEDSYEQQRQCTS